MHLLSRIGDEELRVKLQTNSGRVSLNWGKLGWAMGFEPTTLGATVRCSTAELRPPQRGNLNMAAAVRTIPQAQCIKLSGVTFRPLCSFLVGKTSARSQHSLTSCTKIVRFNLKSDR
jgi:hypothetical protein